MVDRFVRAIGLTAVNEARLLCRDPVSLLMLLIAPVVIMTVAGYSLGALYGSSAQVVTVPIVDHDGGEVAADLARATPADSRLRLEQHDDLAAVRRRIIQSGYSPLALEVAAGTKRALAAGRPAALVLYVDPARRLEVNALELELGVIERRAAAAARARVQRALAAGARDLRHALRHLDASVQRQRRRGRTRLAADETRAIAALRTRTTVALERSRRDIEAAMRNAAAGALAALRAQLADRHVALQRVGDHLRALDESRAAWERWLTELRTSAGRQAAKLPPPPPFPPAPPETDLALLMQPIVPPEVALELPPSNLPALVSAAAEDAAAALSASGLAAFADDGEASAALTHLRAERTPTLPGTLEIVERPAVDGASVRVNAFDQYVPGFGVTFLLIGMMLGISLTLFDERDWGTLQRVRAGGASLAGILIGKVLARVVIGVAQMIVLFGVGWALFDIALGRQPAALLLPMISMSFAGAALGLVIPTIAPAHDSVMPLGTMTSLAMAAVGGCWWPLDFEPAWMRTIAHWLPTTWTMQAYNDLMIRGAPPSAAVVPFLVTMTIGCAVLAIGVAAGLATQDSG